MRFKCTALIFLILSLNFVSCAMQDEWPQTYDDIEWTEISRSQASEIWKTYDTSTMRHCDLVIWQKWIGLKPQKWSGCQISGSSYQDAQASVAASLIGKITTNPEEEEQNAVFYMKKNDTSLIKIERMPKEGVDNCTIDIYKNGWCVVKKTYRNFSSYEFNYIEYQGF